MGTLTKVEYSGNDGIFTNMTIICTFDNARIIRGVSEPNNGLKIGTKYKLDCWNNLIEVPSE
jgi:hypothetical protein